VLNEKVLAQLISCGFRLSAFAISGISIFDEGKPFECNAHRHPVTLILLEIETTWFSSIVQHEQFRNSLHFKQQDDSRFSSF
jgi:hypothetical protein